MIASFLVGLLGLAIVVSATVALARSRAAPAPDAATPSGDRFAICLERVLAAEGGFANDPADPGGATKFGITRANLQDWRGAPVHEADVRALTLAEAAAIYRARYWDAMRCGILPTGIDLMVFDCGVHAGVSQSVKFLQRATGAVVDGILGPQTAAAAAALPSREVIQRLAALRLGFCRSLPTWARFGKGWTRRIETMKKAALAMIG